MKDKLGQEVQIGDMVACVIPRYQNIEIGKVWKITEQTVYIQYGQERFQKCRVSPRNSEQFVVIQHQSQ